MLSNILIWLGFSIASGICYRIGGWKVSAVRDWGIACLFVAYMWQLGAISGLWQWVSMLFCFFGLAGALSSYKYFLPKPKDYDWYFYSLHGFVIALSAIFYAFASGHWLGFSIRLVALPILYGAWFFLAKKSDILHEGGRGGFLMATVPLLLI